MARASILSLGVQCFLMAVGAQGKSVPLERIQLPPGFEIHLYAVSVPNARSMTRSPSGIVFVGTRNKGDVYAVIDRNQDYIADQVITIASGLRRPNGVAFRKGALYVAEVSRVLRYDNIESNLTSVPEPVVVNDSFPTDDWHGWKYIAFSPDDWLYVPVGAPCNVCNPKDPRYASIMRMRPDGSDLEIYAHGIRNTLGFDWHPQTGEMWFTENGRDWMGDNTPPDELNHAPRKGMHFGFPYCHGADIRDPLYANGHSCDEFTPPEMEIPAHAAVLGMKFYTGSMFPPEYRNQVFIAEHGSWNRTIPTGYRVMVARFKDGRPASYEVFADGWNNGLTQWGRPVDLLVMPDGSLLVSDDHAGVIYRITYRK